MLQDRTKTRPSTTTAQIAMKRCGLVPARIPMTLLSRMAAKTFFGNRRFVGISSLLFSETLTISCSLQLKEVCVSSARLDQFLVRP